MGCCGLTARPAECPPREARADRAPHSPKRSKTLSVTLRDKAAHQTYLNTVIAIRIAEQLLEPRAVQKLVNKHLARAVFRNSDALRTT